jgi:manganese efflux pump family protein
MEWSTNLLLAVGLGMDAFAVSLAVGSCRTSIRFRPLFRLSFHFGLFQFLMPIVGWWLGQSVDQYIRDYDHWIAFILLAGIGVRMIKESRETKSDRSDKIDHTRGWMLVLLSIATSIDALAVGLSMAFLGVDIWIPSLVIGIVAAAMTAVGMIGGGRLGCLFGKRMELLGGIILVGIGLKILLEHLGIISI